jgi:hypothetical protein
MWYETQNVPISRVFTNLQQRLAKNTNDFELVYYLARLHAMAYSTNLTSVAIATNNNLPRFYFPGSDTGVPPSVQTFATPPGSKGRPGPFDQRDSLLSARYSAAQKIHKRERAKVDDHAGAIRTWLVP